MGLFDAREPGRPGYGAGFSLRIAGAESNFAVGLSRLGIPARWVSRVGADLAGDLIREALTNEGVDVRYVSTDPVHPTGVFLKWRVDGLTQRSYHRAGSAASALSVADLVPGVLSDVCWVHVGGLTQALSPSARACVAELAIRAVADGIPVSFDLNYRSALWPSAADAAAAAREILPLATWVLCSREEAADLFLTDDITELGRVISGECTARTVIRVGASGAYLVGDAGPELVPISDLEATIEDEVGAGDAFAAGFVTGILAGQPPLAAIRLAHSVAARALRGTGDWETLPAADDPLLQPLLRASA